MKHLATILTFVFCSFGVFGQNLNLESKTSAMEIQGTSSIHDWESNVEQFNVSANFTNDEITDVKFTAIVKSIKSGKSGMDDNTYKALKETDFPEITFTAKSLSIQNGQLLGNGNLTIAGTTKEIPLALSIQNDSKVTITGEIKIKMTDFNITPPTAVFGTIKTGDDIIIQIDFTLIKS